MADSENGRPVLSGLLALAGVGLVVGVLISGGALAVTQVFGLGGGGGSSTSSTASSRESMILPTPVPTTADTGPAVTLAPVPAPGAAAGDGGVDTAAPAPPPVVPATAITLTAGATEVRPNQEIPLSGTYPGGDGATLQIERLSGDTWSEFPVDAQVRGDTFSTYIRTSQTGAARFRMRDIANGQTSNEVAVTIG